MLCPALLLSVGLSLAPTLGEAVPDTAPVHLGLSLAVTHPAELAELRRAQQDPASPDFRRWITPQEYGARFGQSPGSYAAVGAWLRGQGFEVTESPNRTFIEGLGTAAKVTKLLGVHLRRVAGQPAGVHVPDGAAVIPGSLAPLIVHLSGLDTRVRTHHHLAESGGTPSALGPQDLRRFYDLAPLLDAGYVGQGQQLVVLGEAEPPASAIAPQAINYFLNNVSDARAPVIYDVLPNPQEDVDPGGGNEEFEPDCELQSVGAPGAESITLVESPASEVFTTGANEIVNNHAGATAISVSLGICEPEEDPSEAKSLQNTVVQGTLEGQTWSASTGDTGTDDCQDGVTVSVDFPASLPEFVAMGGTLIANPVFDADTAMLAYETEDVWGTQNAGAAGGGLSALYATPSYQTALGVTARSVPDLVLLAGDPGVATDSSNPFIGLPMAAQLTQFEGTSASSPLSAGFFALIASRVGCRLGDPHAALYALGTAQFDGGATVYHDITVGSVAYDGLAGPSAAVGFDSASGWGSLDVAALAAAWPKCPADGGFGFDAGLAAEPSYDQCAFIACPNGVSCVTLPEGPSSCEVPCGGSTACAAGMLCTPGTIFADAGLCAPGCATDADCLGDGGSICNACEETCVSAGNADAGVGIACNVPSDCATSGLCITQDMFGNVWPGGYCTTFCDPTGTLTACGCPAGSICGAATGLCLDTCPAPGHGCRTGYVCQPDGDDAGTSSCQLPCAVVQGFDTCQFTSTPTLACDVDSGVCGGPKPLPVPDAGPVVDAGADAGAPADAGADGGSQPPPKSGGCNCGAGAGDASLLFGVALLAVLRRRRFGAR